MSEWRALIEAARELRARRESAVSATVVRVRGSSYRRPGARMLAGRERWLAGSISGGCLERDVLAKGLWRTRQHAAVLVNHDPSADERTGSGCHGSIDLLIERADRIGPCDPFVLAERCLRDESEVMLVSVFASRHPQLAPGARLAVHSGGWEHDLDPAARSVEPPAAASPDPRRPIGPLLRDAPFARSERAPLSVDQRRLIAPLLSDARLALARGEREPQLIEHHGVEALLERIAPPPHLFIFGSGHDVGPLIALARALGWTISVWDAQPRFSARERLRELDQYLTGDVEDAVARMARCVSPAALVMGHHLEQDTRALAALLRSDVRYIGVLGPRARTDQMLSDCAAAGHALSEVELARVYAPVGLQLGAETPSEIALSIVAEVQAVLCGTAARSLRAQRGDIQRASAPRGAAPDETGPQRILREAALEPAPSRTDGAAAASLHESALAADCERRSDPAHVAVAVKVHVDEPVDVDAEDGVDRDWALSAE